jgi:hypothetical protein
VSRSVSIGHVHVSRENFEITRLIVTGLHRELGQMAFMRLKRFEKSMCGSHLCESDRHRAEHFDIGVASVRDKAVLEVSDVTMSPAGI